MGCRLTLGSWWVLELRLIPCGIFLFLDTLSPGQTRQRQVPSWLADVAVCGAQICGGSSDMVGLTPNTMGLISRQDSFSLLRLQSRFLLIFSFAAVGSVPGVECEVSGFQQHECG